MKFTPLQKTMLWIIGVIWFFPIAFVVFVWMYVIPKEFKQWLSNKIQKS